MLNVPPRWRIVLLLVVAASVAVFARSHAGQLAQVARATGSIDPTLVTFGVIVSILGIVNRGALNRAAHRAVGLEVQIAPMVVTAAVGYAAQKLVKPASAAGLAVFVSHGRRRGHRGATVAAACTLAATAALAALGVSLVATICVLVAQDELTGWWVIAAGAFGGYAALLAAAACLSCRPGRAAGRLWGLAARLPGCSSIRSDECAPPPALLDAVAAARRRPGQVIRTVGHAVASKALGATMLMLAAMATGARVDIVDLIVVYATALAASTVSLLPGGLGAVEASTAALLVSRGVEWDRAMSAVAVFRVFDLWLPVLVGAVVARIAAPRRNRDEDCDLDGDGVAVGSFAPALT